MRAIVGDNNGMAGPDPPHDNVLCGADKLYMQGTCVSDKADLQEVLDAGSSQAAPWLRRSAGTDGQLYRFRRETWWWNDIPLKPRKASE